MTITTDSRFDVRGHVSPGFEPVASEFQRILEEDEGHGAALAVEIDGRCVIDIHGGVTPDGRDWTRDTTSVVFSVGKGITSLALLEAVDRGALALDRPVADYWPEFGAAGKERLTVRSLLGHRAGLVAPEVSLAAADLARWDPIADALAAQAPLWEPDSAYGYHPLTFGWLAGELLRRVTRRTPGHWLYYQMRKRPGASMRFGGSRASASRSAVVEAASPSTSPSRTPDETLWARALSMNGAFSENLFTASETVAFLAQEIPAANLVTRARDLAWFYSASSGGSHPGPELSRAVLADACQPISTGQPFYGVSNGNVWGAGLMVPSPTRRMVGAASFGHDGAGGQLAFGDLDWRLGFGFQTSLARGDGDHRSEDLCTVLRDCL